ncbi:MULTISPECIES: helix-turn-helix domain-containing protein [Gammaproteobacteria]|uniref:helix-turn-helix domain-containing protein n=1 Tax=Gammaproteobacteria TaxID=1236 RepID=UPI000DD070F1|nr:MULTISPECIES: helix-turn-helix transcriptional regulator [Gammaproteobacteria]RTE86744.1 XRE family transcriptional regulator [Aliidiomarina sp. B3213]TCZ90702.1 XRE family transcriptional regulator [Lysobacter sp. N42]
MQIDVHTVKSSRTQKGWTQQQLAEVAGLSLRTVQRVESQGQGSIETCNALCAVLELEREQLLGESKTSAKKNRSVVLYILLAMFWGFLCGVAATLMLN